MLLGETSSTGSKGAIITDLKFGAWIGSNKDVLKGDKPILGIDLSHALPEGARDGKAVGPFALMIALEEVVEVLVVPHLVGGDKARDPLQYRFVVTLDSAR